MLKWIQGGISAVTGIAEPEYGREFIHPLTEKVEGKQPFHQTTREDFNWQSPSHTNVETATFYFSDLKQGYTGFVQVIHSNIVGLHTKAQLTFRIYNVQTPELNVWTSTKLENFQIDGPNFYADGLSIEMDAAGSQVQFKSSVSPDTTIDLTFDRVVPGVKVGENSTTYYGDNVEQPWGTMRHIFWPRNLCHGSLKFDVSIGTEAASYRTVSFSKDVPVYSMFVMAIQGMKPHHAAKSWNFLNFQSDTHSAVLMEFTTPRSYGNTEISVGILCSKDDVIAVTINNKVTHLDPIIDSVGWSIPQSLVISFKGVSSKVADDEVATATPITASVEGPLTQLVERVDVMKEIPSFVKNIVSGVAGTKPYIYQYANDFKLKVGEEAPVNGLGWCEITFISEADEVTEESYSEN
ncbi:LANO_0B04808g1_1 [Lachancea nothofagi CBS 11611]|uniref:LANO_0B04808g1_1 n=1 Tax=Lachancea nothofagi CBS 11611 TaxID=1266666 RepID=A0A1G4IY31_9SACH|nr:LANO_0B04808g1_1 [Lachancea nothofagi CBS 11611]